MTEPSPFAWHWGDELHVAGLVRRPFQLTVRDRVVPGLLWRRHDHPTMPSPLVLLLHGGSGHKADDAVVEQVRMLTCDTDFLVATIDGPFHGDRIGAPGLAGEAMRDRFLTQWSVDPLIDDMVEDWQAAHDGLSTLPDVDASRIGWLGTSMGTAYGLPFVAACPAIKAAVLGKWSGDHVHGGRLRDDAPRVRCPVLFIQRWDDELFSRLGQMDLFDRIGSADKRLHVYPGSHFLRGGEPLADSIAFLKSRL